MVATSFKIPVDERGPSSAHRTVSRNKVTIDSLLNTEYRDVVLVAVCAANPEIRPFVFPAVSASFLCDACAVQGFGLA